MHRFLFTPLWIAFCFMISGCSTAKRFAGDSKLPPDVHLIYLASDSLAGRYPGTSGDSLARLYIQQELKRNNIVLLYNNGFQELSFNQSKLAGSNNFLSIGNRRLENNRDFRVCGISSADTATGKLAFAGYGISVTRDSFKWDDYTGINVSKKWVLLIRGFPDFEGSAAAFEAYADDRDKAMLARDNGASGVLLVSGRESAESDPLVAFDPKLSSSGIPVFHIKRSVADELLLALGKPLLSIEKEITGYKRPFSFETDDSVHGVSDVVTVKGKTFNIAGMIKGYNPVLKDEYIVIGAHYDHLGMGGAGSSSRQPDTLAVHNGADDNASGVAAMLALAGEISRNRERFKRSVILVSFGGEELGLIGSKQFVASPPVDLSGITAMINLDMVGRYDSIRGLQVSGTGTSLESDSLVSLAGRIAGMNVKKSQEGFGPSDHASFYGKDIPVFFITTGAHTDYHTPGDDWELINFKGLNQTIDFTYTLAEKIANHPSRLNFREAGPKAGTTAGRRFKVTLGFMPGYASDSIDGVPVEFVTKGKPAALGGIMGGDVIKSINGMPVHNIYDYMYRLSRLSPGDTISVEIERASKKEIFIIQL